MTDVCDWGACRVVDPHVTAVKTVAGLDFMSYGAHINTYPHAYLTVACSIGISQVSECAAALP